ncbi:MAG: D-aminoacylase [Thermoanaerobaculia bacterium]
MKFRSALLLVALSSILSACATGAKMQTPQTFDLLITNGRIIDGTGAPWFRGDVGITADTIVAVGDLSHAHARRTIDAHGQIVAPGFIDLLGQDDHTVLVDPRLEGKIRQGVTTELTGEGHSPGPVTAAQQEARAARGGPSWRTLGEYMNVVEKNRSAINMAFLVGQSSAREIVMGDVDRDPTPEELRQMEAIVDQAMREGAIGLSSALIYVPAVFSKTDELIALARVAAKRGGVYFTHIRNEADTIDDALDEAFRIGREARIPLNIWHLKVGGKQNWGRMPEVIAKIEAARESGLDVSANVYPYIASSTGLSALAPNQALEGGYSKFLERLKDPVTRAKIADEIRESGFYHRIDGAVGVLVTRIPNSKFAQYERKRLSEIATMMGLDPIEALLRIFEQSPRSPQAIYFSMNEQDLRYALQQPFVSVGSDSAAIVGPMINAGAHPRAYGTFPRVVGHYVRDEHLFTLEEAVRKVTSQAAARALLFDRGVLRPGMKGDVVVFDPEKIRDISTYEDPHHMSEGVIDVVVNGAPVLLDGTMTGELPGRVLRGPGYEAR